jgi:hypothetical protein
MRVYVAVVDVRCGDVIAHGGEVRSVDIQGDDVVLTMHWADSREYRLAADAEIWVDRKDPAPLGGVA